MTPSEAVYGLPPPSLIDYFVKTSPVATVDEFLSSQDSVLKTLHQNLLRAQNRMQNHANSGCTDISFAIDDYGF